MKIIYKRFKIIGGCLIIGLLTFFSQQKGKTDIVSTMAVPVTNKVIVVDAGHGRRRWRSD